MIDLSQLKVQRSLLPCLLFVSGLCGISYEVLYGRLLGNVFGDQFLVSTAVLLTFMLGLGLGAYHSHRLWRHLWLMEAGIGLYAMMFTLNLGGIESLLYTLLPGIGTAVISSLVMGIALLLIPAFLIGVSLPLFSGYAHFLRPGPNYFVSSYSLYNFAAAGTVLFVEFWLVRQVGVNGAVYLVGSLNLLVAVTLLISFRRIARGAPRPARVTTRGFPRAVILALILSSVGSAIFQLTTVRLSELLIGPYRESFAYVLCIILLGIALGSQLVQRFRIGFATLMVVNIIALAWMLGGLEWAMEEFAEAYQLASKSYWQLVGLRLTLVAGLTLAAAITFGATIPALLQTLEGQDQENEADHRQSVRSPGYLLYVSSLANAAGFVLMSLVLHQHLDYGELLLVAAAFSAASLVVIVWHRSANQDVFSHTRAGQVALGAMLFLLLAGGRSQWNEELLYQGHMSFHSPNAMRKRIGEFATSERFKGPADVFSISRRRGKPYLMISGKISINLESPKEKIVGALAGIYATDHRRALVLGVGSGATAGSVGLLFDEVEAVEISGVILQNLRRMEEYNFGLADMANVSLVHDDAVHSLKVAQEQYSLILNTVTSPLFFSSSKLYTVEFLDHVRQRLAPGGLYVTWLDSRVGDRGADIMIETVTRAFDHCGLAQMGRTYLLLMCSDRPITAHHPLAVAQQEQLSAYLQDKHGIDPAGLPYLLLNANAATLRNPGGAPVNTLDKPVLEFEMARLTARSLRELQHRIIENIKPVELADAFKHFNWGLDPMLRALPPIVGENLYYGALLSRQNEARGHYRRFLAAKQTGDCNGVIENAAGAAILNTQMTQLHLPLGRCYEIKGRYSEALAAYRREQELDPGNMRLTLILARVLMRLERYQEALTELRRTPMQEHSGGYFFMLGLALHKLGDLEEAQRQFSRAKQIDGDLEAASASAQLITGQRDEDG
jgi:spermidine synthase